MKSVNERIERIDIEGGRTPRDIKLVLVWAEGEEPPNGTLPLITLDLVQGKVVNHFSGSPRVGSTFDLIRGLVRSELRSMEDLGTLWVGSDGNYRSQWC